MDRKKIDYEKNCLKSNRDAHTGKISTLLADSSLKNAVDFGELSQEEADCVKQELEEEDYFNKNNEDVPLWAQPVNIKNSKPEKKPLFNKINMAIDFSLESLPPRTFIVERLNIEESCFYTICASGGSGKSMFLQYLACCIDTGTPLFGEFKVTKGAVYHIDQEQNLNQTKRRYIRIFNGLGNKLPDNLERTNLERRLDCAEEIDTIEEDLTKEFQGKTLVIIDSLKAISEADENTADIEKILKIFKRVAEKTKCAIVLIHHKGKNSTAKQSGRGHSSIYDSVDGQIDLDYDQDTRTYTLSCAKVRDGVAFDGIRYQLKDEGDFNFEQKCSYKLVFEMLMSNIKPKERDINKLILKMINDSIEKYNQTNLYNIIKGDRNILSRALKELADKKFIDVEKGSKNSSVYSITELGKKHIEDWSEV